MLAQQLSSTTRQSCTWNCDWPGPCFLRDLLGSCFTFHFCFKTPSFSEKWRYSLNFFFSLSKWVSRWWNVSVQCRTLVPTAQFYTCYEVMLRYSPNHSGCSSAAGGQTGSGLSQCNCSVSNLALVLPLVNNWQWKSIKLECNNFYHTFGEATLINYRFVNTTFYLLGEMTIEKLTAARLPPKSSRYHRDLGCWCSVWHWALHTVCE